MNRKLSDYYTNELSFLTEPELYNILDKLKDDYQDERFELIKYISFRAGLAAITAFLISLLIGSQVIKILKRYKVSEDTTKKDSEKLKDLHSNKKDVPTMGGIIILIAVLLSTLLWCNIFNIYILLVLFTAVWLGILGFFDDYIKLTQSHSSGLTSTSKLFFQCGLGLIIGLILYFHFMNIDEGTKLVIPFFKETRPELGAFYVLMVMFFMVGMSNAVNITDGLDGLAIGCTVIAGLAFTLITYIVGRVDFSSYLNVPYISGVGELSIFCSALVGAGLGFMWFNCFIGVCIVIIRDVGVQFAVLLGNTCGQHHLRALRQELHLQISARCSVQWAVS